MSASQRRKGATAERELARLLSPLLGEEITRNLAQSRDGGADLLGVGPFALEVKRQERLTLPAWWRQACEQAERAGLIPALAYRQSRQPWRFVVPLAAIMGAQIGKQAVATLDLDGFVAVTSLTPPPGEGRMQFPCQAIEYRSPEYTFRTVSEKAPGI